MRCRKSLYLGLSAEKNKDQHFQGVSLQRVCHEAWNRMGKLKFSSDECLQLKVQAYKADIQL